MAPPSGHSFLLISLLGVFAFHCFTRGQKNSTLIFATENTIRNCSCSADIRDCDYSLANLMCSCKTVLPFAVERTSYSGHLTIWFTDTSALGLLLNFTLVQDLKLSLCGTNTLPTEYLAIWGLKRLRINTEAKHASPEQSLLVHSAGEAEPRDKPLASHTGWQTCSFSGVNIATITNVKLPREVIEDRVEQRRTEGHRYRAFRPYRNQRHKKPQEHK